MIFSTALATNVIIPLLSLSGLLGGMLLSYLAREELAAGKKYFVMSYRILFVLLSLIVAYFISSSSFFSSSSSSLSFSIAIIFLFLAIILLILDLKKSYRALFLFQYLFFLTGYFVAEKQIIIAVILFLYGLPVGTLLQIKN